MSDEVLLLVVFAGAFFSPVFARILRMPVPVGELIFGLTLGHLLGEGGGVPEILSFLSEIGFLILMFLAGLEIDFNLLERTSGLSLGIYLVYTILIFLSGFFISLITGIELTALIILSLISVGLMIATLRDTGLSATPLGKKVLILGVIGELMSLFALTLLEKLGEFRDWKSFFLDVGTVMLFLFGFFLVFHAIKLLIWWYPEIVKTLTYEEDPSAIDIRLSFFLIFSASIIAHIAEIESVLGSFLAGALFSFFIRKKHDIELKFSSIGYGLFIPIFFIKTGMGMNLAGVSSNILFEVLLLTFLIFLLRLLPSPVLLLAGFSPKEIFISSLSLSYPFTLMIAATEIARSSGLISEERSLSLFIAAALSSLIFPWSVKIFSLKTLRRRER
ncbi:monovalent cation:proton antiporter-2 (CPA2) family protein [Aquifex pyrophilus]